ncbi:hypothetical protein A1O1_03000 [Capronia coronata CBS 617.96]|uniref:Uncharacterized protein n=1 Tax=Capronia coronata CBS 617.96 TaxID=1182541 RepID=W9ZJC8_9EURO|nr:uncharacterized protein A1O1_03000 [Capronia coronata CBS 617.96]EXJ94604.1 hypothetical protein A1O1_03000 [Capronia coronata CBS 617.96]
MAKISIFLGYLHALLIQVPQHGYHNISRVFQPQIRSLADSLTANTSRVGKEIELQSMKPKQTGGAGAGANKNA